MRSSGKGSATHNDASSPNDDNNDPAGLCLLRDLPARNKVLFCDTPDDSRQAAWAAVGIALAYDDMEIEV